jgi:hypothetical protein
MSGLVLELEHKDGPVGHVVNLDALPEMYPTNFHDAVFWEWLGRTIGTYGFLEDTLGRAIFSFTGTRKYSEEDAQKAYEEWLPTLKRALSDPLGGLIDSYSKAVRDHPDATISNFDDLVDDLRKAAVIRNVLCHGSWENPDEAGATTPRFFNRHTEKFETKVDFAFLQQVQRHVAQLTGVIVSSVTHMGWQFPGTGGPGNPIWQRS